MFLNLSFLLTLFTINLGERGVTFGKLMRFLYCAVIYETLFLIKPKVINLSRLKIRLNKLVHVFTDFQYFGREKQSFKLIKS